MKSLRTLQFELLLGSSNKATTLVELENGMLSLLIKTVMSPKLDTILKI